MEQIPGSTGTSTGAAPAASAGATPDAASSFSHHLTIPTRTLVHKKPLRTAAIDPKSMVTLEDVRDQLQKIIERQEPIDYTRSLDQLHVSFVDGVMYGQWLMPNKTLSPDKMRFHEVGAQQTALEVLPSRFFRGLQDLIAIDTSGEKLATMVWAKFGTRATEPRLVRTVNMKLDGKVQRVVRSCHSQDYAPYGNLEFVQSLLDSASDFATLPVAEWRLTDTGMRIRFVMLEGSTVELKTPIPMIEAWNSEVGMRRVVLRGGMYRFVCTNGMGTWDERHDYSWIHRGNPERIRKGVHDAYENLMTAANGVVEAYNQALTTSIDDAYTWMETMLQEAKVPERVIANARTAMDDATTTRGGLLASVIDAITLVAQEEMDMYAQYELERVAANVLRKGRAEALVNGGKISV